MRPLAVCCILAVVVWAAAVALNTRTANRQLAPAVYAVGEPIAVTTAVPIPLGSPLWGAMTEPMPVGDSPAVVAVPAVRLQAVQLEPTVPPPPTALTVPHYTQWQRLAECESGGDWSINTGNGYYGGLQFSLQSWRGAGGDRYAAYPHQASTLEQMQTAERLLAMQGWGAWPTCARRLGLR